MSMECQVNVKSQSELDIGGRETCSKVITVQLYLSWNEMFQYLHGIVYKPRDSMLYIRGSMILIQNEIANGALSGLCLIIANDITSG